MITPGLCRTEQCREARINIGAVHLLTKSTAPKERPLFEKVKEAISHVRLCEFCLFWFRDSCCGYIKQKYPHGPSLSGLTLYNMHRDLHKLLHVELVSE